MRKPDFEVPGYLQRWYIIPRNKFFNIYLHRFIGSDKSVFHDHPWDSLSFCFKGMMIEHMPGRKPRVILAPSIIYRSATHQHFLEKVGEQPIWTLFITGPRKRDWGFIDE